MRVTTTKSKSDESFYINYAFINEKGKSTSRIYKKLGKLSELSKELNTDRDGVMAWAKEQARIETEKYKKENESVSIALNPNIPIKKDQQNTFNCGYLFLQSIYYSLHLDNICRNIKNRHDYEYNLNAILSDLIYARFLNPTSKLSSFKYCHSLLEQPTYHLHDIYRALTVLAEESDYIQAELYRNSNYIHKRNTRVLYYDCTNYFFEIELDDEFRKYGINKQHQPKPQVGMGLFMDGDGIPLSFNIYPGNQNEQKTLIPEETKIVNNFKMDTTKMILCTDAGLASDEIKKYNIKDNRGFVITQSLKKLKDSEKEKVFDDNDWRLPGDLKNIYNLNEIRNDEELKEKYYDKLFYKIISSETKSVKQDLIVTFSFKYFDYNRNIRNSQIERAKKSIDTNQTTRKGKNQNDYRRFIVDTKSTDTGEVAENSNLSLDEDLIKQEEQYDGYYALTTNLVGDIEQILKITKGRWEIEESFRIMKTDFLARPVNLSREDRIKSHFLTCFMALLIYRILEKN